METKEQKLYNKILEYQICGAEALDLITNIYGLNMEVLSNIVEYKTSYKTIEEFEKDIENFEKDLDHLLNLL